MSFMVVLSLTLTGCVQSLNITAENADMLAEYMAALVLKYDRYYDQELIYVEPEEESETVTEVLPEPTEEVNIGDTGGDGSTGTKEESYHPPVLDLMQVMDVKYFDVKYSKYGLYDSFPKNMENKSFVLEARAGRKYLVAEFEIKNKTKDSKAFDMMSKSIGYELNVDSKSMYRPIMTLLVNDMQYIDITLGGGKTAIGYLVFEVPEKVKLSNANIVVTNNNTQATVALK